MAEHTVTLFAHTNREHASTSTQIVAKHQRLHEVRIGRLFLEYTFSGRKSGTF